MSNENVSEGLQALAKHVKTEQDIADLSRTLLKMTVETALGAEQLACQVQR